MDTSSNVLHVVAVPYPGRGHINPIINLCKLLASRKNDIQITVVVTEEWLGFIGSDPKPNNISFRTIPNVLPSELVRGTNYPAFYEAVMTKMEAPFEKLLDQIHPPVTAIIADIELLWAVPAGRWRNIPVASLSTLSASVFHLLFRNRELNSLDCGDQIPGISSTDLADLGEVFKGNDPKVIKLALECISWVPKAQYLLFTSVYELEPQIFDSLQAEFPFPVYPIGPAIPYLEPEHNCSVSVADNSIDYLKWLDSQPKGSVLYISLGSFLSVSSTQMDEIAAGLRNSGIRYLWVARGEASRLKESCNGEMGLVVSWCEQLKVLCHSSVGGFWTHCGWNSTLEAVFAGVPMLTFPLFLDQLPNSRQIVEEWRIGGRVKTEVQDEKLMTREEIAELVKRFMDLENSDGKEMRKRAKESSDLCHQAIAKGGSSDTNLDNFIRDIGKAPTF
ncbi:PREDICTED: UDP-glycosyltransferase [Prunus dulcis]|uniref:PREDICTED: UDP-glycosyltransferase n=1 Tax=Prunus dulcis TaxID=3755 RepID=A0A5E4EL85_PRUDU|nr:PREDICTED: UDP-glycosyltransferase [Prunus dulcis]